MEIQPAEIAFRIRKVMLRAGCNQQELASLAGISQPAVSLYLNGRIPPADVLLTLAKLGDTSIEWLLTGETSVDSSLMLRERPAVYGTEGALLEIWRDLDSGAREDMLRLMHRLRKK